MSNFSRQGPQNVKIYEYDQTLEEFMELDEADLFSVFHLDVFRKSKYLKWLKA